MIPTRRQITRTKHLLAQSASEFWIASRLGVRVADARLLMRLARAALRYGEPAPVFRSDDEIRRRQAENAQHRA